MQQLRLLHEEQAYTIPGLRYVADYISIDQEAGLLAMVDSQEWRIDLKRRVQHYGYKYDYSARGIDEKDYIGEIPGWLKDVAVELQRLGIFSEIPDQVIVNEYLPGQSIAPHVDCTSCFGPAIASISLASPCIMDLIKEDSRIGVELMPRSLLIISDEARYKWKHGIAARKTDMINGLKIARGRRVSLTFRNVMFNK